MPTPIFERLRGYYAHIGMGLRDEAKVADIFPNTTDKGMSREQIYARMLKLHLPSSCNVMLGGFLFDQDGNESKQLDILIVNDLSVQFNFLNKNGNGKSFACIDGCIGVVSIKSMLDSNALTDALCNIASIPDKQPLGQRVLPLVNIPGYDDWPCKVIYAPNGIRIESLMESLNEFYRVHPDIPFHKRPNLIHVGGKYVVSRVPEEGQIARNGTSLPPNIFYAMLDNTDVFGLCDVITRMHRIALSAKHIITDYAEMFDKIPLDQD
jgi:hypothetical protein